MFSDVIPHFGRIVTRYKRQKNKSDTTCHCHHHHYPRLIPPSLSLSFLFLSYTVDVFQSFRRLSLNNFQLEPLNFLTLPSLSLSAAMKFTKVKLQLISDVDIYQFFERYKRGGLVFVGHRRCQLNIPGYPNYDPKKPTSLSFYLDANNL